MGAAQRRCGLPSNESVELRGGRRYFIPGAGIGLAVTIHDFRRGENGGGDFSLVSAARWAELARQAE